MTGIALLWSTRRDIDPEAFQRLLRENASRFGEANRSRTELLLWDGEGELLRMAPAAVPPSNRRWALALAATRPETGEPESSGAALDSESGHALVLSGRVRNARDLLRELVCGPASQGEGTQCLLGLLARKGPAALQELAGEWALAFFDRLQVRLTLGTDRVGVEPIYYRAGADRVAASTSPVLALALSGSTRRADREWLLACAASGARPLPDDGATAYAGLQRLRPGATLQVELRQGALRTDLLRVGLLESFVDLPADAARLGPELRMAAATRLPDMPALGVAWTGGPGAVAVAALAAQWTRRSSPDRSDRPARASLYALEQSGASGDLAALAARELGLPLRLVPWPEHAVIEARRAALVRETGLPLVAPFPALEMDLLAGAMAADGLRAAWSGTGARELLGVDADFAGQAMRALARRRRILPALALRHALEPQGRPFGSRLSGQLAFLLRILTPRAYRSTREQARIELLSHHARNADQARLLAVYRQCLDWREQNSPRRMQLQRLTRGSGPARLADLRLAAARHGLDLALPLLDARLARYLRLPLARRLAQGRECPLLLETLGEALPRALQRELPGSAALLAAAHAPVERLAALPERSNAALQASPLLNALFPDLRALLADLEQLRDDARFRDLPNLLDALAEWERECRVVI